MVVSRRQGEKPGSHRAPRPGRWRVLDSHDTLPWLMTATPLNQLDDAMTME
jgi:hypothetical protein